MRHVGQEDGGSLCGHACLAMLAGQSLAQVVREVGHPEGIITREIVGYLRRHRLRAVGDRFGRLPRGVDPPVPVALCQVSWYQPTFLRWGGPFPGYRRDMETRHLVVWRAGRYWDPDDDGVRARWEAERPIDPGFRGLMTSYLEVRWRR